MPGHAPDRAVQPRAAVDAPAECTGSTAISTGSPYWPNSGWPGPGSSRHGLAQRPLAAASPGRVAAGAVRDRDAPAVAGSGQEGVERPHGVPAWPGRWSPCPARRQTDMTSPEARIGQLDRRIRIILMGPALPTLAEPQN